MCKCGEAKPEEAYSPSQWHNRAARGALCESCEAQMSQFKCDCCLRLRCEGNFDVQDVERRRSKGGNKIICFACVELGFTKRDSKKYRAQ